MPQNYHNATKEKQQALYICSLKTLLVFNTVQSGRWVTALKLGSVTLVPTTYQTALGHPQSFSLTASSSLKSIMLKF
jgi:hypothetical protein